MKKLLNFIKPVTLSVLIVFSSCCHSDTTQDETVPVISAPNSETITFIFTDSSISASKNSDTYKIDGTKLTIKSAGSYKVEGKCSNGSVTIEEETTDVMLILDSFTLSCGYSAPIICGKKSNTTIFLSGYSTLTDKENPENEDSSDKTKADAFEGAVIKAKSNSVLTIKGDGTLNVDASNCKNGIIGLSEAAVRIENGTVNVNAANDGISSDGSLMITGGNINVHAGQNGIESDPDYQLDDVTKKIPDFTGGTMKVTGGNVTISAENCAIKAASALEIGIKGNTSGPKINVTKSTEGLSAAQVYLYSGNGTIISNEDGIYATYKRFTDTDESDGGYQYANDLYNAFKERYGDFMIEVSGGTWYVNADANGLDSDGAINMNDGNITVFGSENNDNSAIKYETTFEVNNGKILAIGTSNMAKYPTKVPEEKSFGVFGAKSPNNPSEPNEPNEPTNPSESSEPTNPNESNEPVHIVGNGQTISYLSIKKGDKIVIKDSENNIVASTTALKNANNVMFAPTDTDKSYKLYINDVEVQENSLP